MARTHRKCGFCQGVMPAQEVECPFCGKSLENYGALGRLLEDLLPDDRPMTKGIAALSVAYFAMVGLLAGGSSLVAPSTYSLIHFGASFPPYIAQGQLWRLVTALFMHGDVLHIGFNLYALWLLGPLIENSFGKARMIIIFLITGLVSTLVSFGWGFAAFDLAQTTGLGFLADASFATPTVGMSGALTGLIGVGVSAGHRLKTAQGAQIRNVMLRWMLFIVLFGIAVPQIDNAAHIGGFLAGLALGFVLPLKDRASRAAGIAYAAASSLAALTIVGSLAAHAISLPRQYPTDLSLYPTGIFGQTLRESDPDNKDFTAAAKSCEDAIQALEAAPDDENQSKNKKIAVMSCDEFSYLLPVAGEGYLYAAHAHAHAGDKQAACLKLRTARLFYDFSDSARQSEGFKFRMDRVSSMAGCP